MVEPMELDHNTISMKHVHCVNITLAQEFFVWVGAFVQILTKIIDYLRERQNRQGDNTCFEELTRKNKLNED